MAIRVPISVVILLSAIILFSVYIESCTPPTAEELENDGWSKFNNRWYRVRLFIQNVFYDLELNALKQTSFVSAWTFLYFTIVSHNTNFNI